MPVLNIYSFVPSTKPAPVVLLLRSLRTKDTSVKYIGKTNQRQELCYAYVSLGSVPSLHFHKYKFPFQICSRVKKHLKSFTWCHKPLAPRGSWGYHCVHVWNERYKTPWNNQTMHIVSASAGADSKCNCNPPLCCFGFLEYPATWHNKHWDIQSKWSSKCWEKLYIIHLLECPPGKLKPTFLGTVNTSGPAKNFSRLLTIPLAYPPKRMIKTFCM